MADVSLNGVNVFEKAQNGDLGPVSLPTECQVRGELPWIHQYVYGNVLSATERSDRQVLLENISCSASSLSDKLLHQCGSSSIQYSLVFFSVVFIVVKSFL